MLLTIKEVVKSTGVFARIGRKVKKEIGGMLLCIRETKKELF